MTQLSTRAWLAIRSMVAMLLLVAGTLSATAQSFISDVCISSHKQRTQAILQAQMKGWEVIDGDLNWDAGGDYIFLCVKRTTAADGAITDMVIMSGSDYKYNSDRSVKVDGLTYRIANLIDDSPSSMAGDLNKDAGGSDLFLYVTRETKSGEEPHYLTSLEVKGLGSSKTDERFVREGKDGGGKGDCMDCNRRAGGRYVYIEMTKNVAPHIMDVDELKNAFNVYSAGGEFYQIEIPLLFKWGEGDSYLVGGGEFSGNPLSTIQYLPDGKDGRDSNWQDAFQVQTRLRPDGKLYDAPRPVFMRTLSGTLFRPSKLSRVTQVVENEYQDYGNNESLKFATLFWSAPEGVEVARFRLVTKGCTVGQPTNNTLNATIEKEDVSMSAPTGMNLVSLLDPMLNLVNTGDAATIVPPGTQILQMQTANRMHRISIWDATDRRIIPECTVYPDDADTRSFSFNLQHHEEDHHLAVLVHGDERVMDEKGTNTIVPRAYLLPVLQHPFHTITSCTVEQHDSISDDGVFGARNIIRWTVPNVRAADVMSEDEFIIQRAYQPDFSDAITIGSVSLGDRPCQELTINHDNDLGTFTFEDPDEAGWYNPIDHERDARIYYRVFRGIVNARWGESSMGDFCKTAVLTPANYLANVSRISVTPFDDFDTEKTVNVRVEIDRPNNPAVFWFPTANIVIQRYSLDHEHYQGHDYAKKTITIYGHDVHYDAERNIYYADIEDIQGAPYLHYYYTAHVEHDKCPYPIFNSSDVTSSSADADRCYSQTLAPVRNLTASRGTVKGRVVVSWEADEGLVDYYTLERRPYGSTSEADYVTLRLKTPLSTTYEDTNVSAAHVYEYRVTATVRLYGTAHTCNDTTYGWNPYYGTLSGSLRLSNGAPLPSKATITVRSVDADGNATDARIDIPEVRNVDNDTLIVPSYHTKYERTITTTDGTFTFDDTPYTATTRYQIEVDADGAHFVRRGQEDADGARVFFVALDNTNITPTVDLICRDTHTFSGRVLYDHTTIPVRDCQFLVNGNLVLNADGTHLTTDSRGNFTFLLPNVRMTLQVVKDGHTFLEDGYIIPRAEDLDVPTDTPAPGDAFTPSADYSGLILYDATTVRLVGRLTGGDVQARKPLGYGLSTNNLGDNLKMILELEGDDTAQIVFDPQHPGETTRHTHYTQPHRQLNGGDETFACPTDVTYEKKRIIIRPDQKTGEYCLDLAPTTYKVTELSADGYPTLFALSEGHQVLDLSHAITLHTDTLSAVDAPHATPLTTAYHATYQRVHHNPVNVTLTQYDMGQPRRYFGAAELVDYDINGQKMKVPLYYIDEEKDSLIYLFDKPLFVEGKEYNIQVSAHEDYYYNGNTQLQPDVVPLEKGMVQVRNGLVGSESDTRYELDKDGKVMVDFIANNANFSAVGEDALRSIRVQIEHDGYYESGELQAYVTGSRKKGNDVITVDDDITLLDVIRDPYGSRSSAYREAGTKYHWEHSSSFKFSNNMKLTLKTGTQQQYFTGVWAGAGIGTLAGVTHGAESSSEWSMSYPMVGYTVKRTEEYDMTLNTRIETSSDPLDVGAMADVYIGAVNTIDISRVETFGIINQSTYELVKPGIENGAIRVVCRGTNDKMEPFYLVVSDKIGVTRGKPRDFIYTQKYIVNVLMPSLDQMAAAQILDCSKEEAQEIANSTHETKYIWVEDEKGEQKIIDIAPNVSDDDKADDKKKNNNVLAPDALWKTMLRWADIVSQNEQTKLEAMQADNPLDKKYSISAASKVEHTEGAEWYDKIIERLSALNIDTDKGWSGWKGISASGAIFLKKFGQYADKKGGHTENVDADSDDEGLIWHTSLNVMGSKLEIKFQPFNPSVEYTNDYNALTTYSGGSGYTIETNDNSYFDINVHQVQPYRVENYFDKEEMEWVSVKDVNEAAKVHEWVYSVKGGAERQPWYEPDSTLFYQPGTPLTTRTLKIDNPRVYIDNPVVSNVPSGEKAIFKIRLANETELSTRPEGMNPSKFVLFLDDEFCPDGAAITMDGQPIADGREFYLDPGQSITKTIVVERCGKTYDYENLRLGFMDAVMSMIDYATLSVHFLPSSTPVNVVMPADKWVLNTLSAVDEHGRYYLPVEVSGYDVNHENFDHIEVQYKKHTDGDSKWVNLCSYYKDKELYEKASGEKAMLGKISLRFYGDVDPVEMQYDLRAVSFCRLGNEFVTKSSEVVTGIKDTRAPEVFGVPKPSNGILTFEDVISVPFSEPIAYNYLDETANFQVVGYTNDSETSYEMALAFSPDDMPKGDGKKGDEVPVSRIKRNLTGRDFTISAVARLAAADDAATFMMIRDHDVEMSDNVADYTLDFCYREGRLVAYINSVVFVSKSILEYPLAERNLSLTGKMTPVAMTYRRPEHTPEGDPQVRFYLDGVELPLESVGIAEGEDVSAYDGVVDADVCGHVEIGEASMNGRLANVRLWDKVLPVNELLGKMNKRLNGTEPGLLGYWPMDEMAGTVLYDKAHGADLHFKYQTWVLPDGQHALRLHAEPLPLQNTVAFARQEYEDYTLGFWMMPQNVDNAATNDGKVKVFAAGASDAKDHFALYFDKGVFTVQSGDNSFDVCPQQTVDDGTWHHVAVVANKSMNACTVFVDGEPRLLLDGDALGAMPESVSLGGDGFSGCLDNVSFWHLALPSNSLSMIYNYAPTGREMGLVYYLPFEMDGRNSQNTWESVFCPYNMVCSYKADGTECDKILAIEGDEAALRELDSTTSYPAVRSMTGLTNIPFSWCSNGNELQIVLKERDALINHQQVFVTVRGVEDLAGNSMTNPLMMGVYVDRSVMAWSESVLDVTVPYGMESDLWAEWTNKCGRAVAYNIVSNNVWLVPSMTMGVAQPLAKVPLTIHIGNTLPPGNYTGVVYLVDENGLSSPLTINLTIEAQEPKWAVTDVMGYTQQMGLVARVRVKTVAGSEYFDTDGRDRVACFDSMGRCVGMASITTADGRYHGYVNMTIYGTAAMSAMKEVLTFRLWRASTNEVFFLRRQDGEPVRFESGGLLGCPPDEPLTLVTYDHKMQNIALDKGWNWISFNVKPGEHAMSSLFTSNETFEVGDYIVFKNRSDVQSTVYSEYMGMGRWSNNDVLNADRAVLNVYVSRPCVVSVAGSEYTDADRYVALSNGGHPQGSWNELPYLLNVDQPISMALSDLVSVGLNDGTIVKSRKEFAVIDRKTNTWVGSLRALQPGVGYYIRYSNDDHHMMYTNTDVAPRNARARMNNAHPEPSAQPAISGAYKSQSAMPVIATVESLDEWQEGDAIVAYAHGEEVGAATLMEMADGRRLAFIMVSADPAADIRFAHVRGDKVMAKSRATLAYDADGVTGTLDQPYMIAFGDDDTETGVYDIEGRRYRDAQSAGSYPGVLIINGKKELKK